MRMVRVPTAASIAAALHDVEAAWACGTDVSDMPWRIVKLVPYFLFSSGRQGAWSPIEDDRFLVSWLRVFMPRRGSKGARILIEEYLRQYPAHDTTGIGRVRNVMRRALRDEPLHPRLEHWRAQQKRVRLLDVDGPERVASAIDDPRAAPDDVLRRLAFTDHGLARARFLMAVLAALAARIRGHLERGDITPERLEVLLQAFRDEPSKELLFHDDLKQRGILIDALLLPWAGLRRAPAARAREIIMRFLLQCVGDPRTHSVSWQPAAPEARTVMLGWLVEDAFESFFGLVDDTAMDSQWQYRRAFWGAYLEEGAIREAWVVLGRAARNRGARQIQRLGMACGSLESAHDPSQSVLLMRIGDITIAEWSHDGACRMWDSGQTAAPQLHRTRYAAHELRYGASFERRHDGSEAYRWQDDLRSRIFSKTGIRIERGTYEV